jgi:hypothetical protein
MTLQPDPTITTSTPMDTTIGTSDTPSKNDNDKRMKTPHKSNNNNRYTVLAQSDDEDDEDNNNNNQDTSQGNNQDTMLIDNINNDPSNNTTQIQMAMYDAPDGIDMETTTVTDFIYQYYQNSYSEPMFTEVWQPIAGAIQLFYQAKRRYEVEDLLPLLRLETARFMTAESIDFAFTDSEILLADLGTDRFWQPFSLTKQIPEADPAILNPYSQQAKQNKRKRRQHQAPRTTPPQNPPYTSSINAMTAIPAEIFVAPSEQKRQLTLTKPADPTTQHITQPSQLTQSTNTKSTDNADLEQHILQLCKTMVDDSAQNLRNDLKTTNETMARKIHDSKETLKTEIRTQLAAHRDETTSQLNQQRQDLETKIDATRQDTIDIKKTQTDLQTTQESILKGQNDVKALLESLTQGIQSLKPDCGPSSSTTPTNNNREAATRNEQAETITQSPTPQSQKDHLPTPMEDVEPSKKRNETEATTLTTKSNKAHKTNKENITGYNGWKALLNYGAPTQNPSERAATPSDPSDSRSERPPLAAKQQ